MTQVCVKCLYSLMKVCLLTGCYSIASTRRYDLHCCATSTSMPKLPDKLGRPHTNGSVCVYLEVRGFFELVSASYHTTRSPLWQQLCTVYSSNLRFRIALLRFHCGTLVWWTTTYHHMLVSRPPSKFIKYNTSGS